MVAFRFPFLTLDMVTGAVWAKKAWGDYRSWDPKETWSLITRFAYLVYLHTPLILPKMNINKSKTSVILAFWLLISFGIVNFTFAGLNHRLPMTAANTFTDLNSFAKEVHFQSVSVTLL